jgi:hypothetical protein
MMTQEKPRHAGGRPRVNVDPAALNMQLPRALLDELRAHTAARGQTVAWFVRQAILEKLERER